MYTREASSVDGHVIRGICAEENSCRNSVGDTLEHWSRLGARGHIPDGERLARTNFGETSRIILATVWFPSMKTSVSELATELRSGNVIASPKEPGFGTKRFSSASRLEEALIRTL
jgi:hypothetical protein